MIYKRSIFQKAVSLLLAASLLVPGVGATARAEAPVEPAEKPQLRVVGTLTDGGKYLELGLSVDSKTANFQSAGALLKYDATKLTPLKWGAIEDTPEALAAAKIAVPTATVVKAAWNEASILPTKSKSADDLVGKTAKAVELPGDVANAYLYLSAEAPKGRTLNQPLPVETGTAPEGLLATTASGKPITAIGAAETPTDQVVTVRFLVGTTTDAGEGAVERNYTLAELVTAIDLVVYDPTAETSDANERALLLASPLTLPTDANAKLEGLSYIADNADYTTAGFTSAADASFVWVAAGQTVDSGGGGGGSADVSRIRTISFLDWDGTTKLGVVAVQAGDILGEDAYKAFLSGKYDPGVMALDKVADDPYALTPIAAEGYVFNPDRMTKPLLTDKGGYTFIGWVPLDAEASHYAKADEAAAQKAVFNWDLQKTAEDAALGADDPYPDLAVGDYVNPIDENIDVKACYVGNSKCSAAVSGANSYFTQYYETVKKNKTEYTVDVKITRDFIPSGSAGQFPARVYDPILIARVVTAAGDVFLPVELAKKDVSYASFTLPSAVKSLILVVTDRRGMLVASNTVARSAAITLNQPNSSGFLSLGLVNSVNEQMRLSNHKITSPQVPVGNDRGIVGTADFLGVASAQDYLNAVLLNTTISGNEMLGGKTVSRLNLFQLELLRCWRRLNSATNENMQDLPTSDLTYAQMAEVGRWYDDLYEVGGAGDTPIQNVYVKNFRFDDNNPMAQRIGGTVSFEPVYTDVAIEGFKVYLSRNGVEKHGNPGTVYATIPYATTAGSDMRSLGRLSGEFTNSNVTKGAVNRFLVLVAYDSNGKEYPVSAVTAIDDLAAD